MKKISIVLADDHRLIRDGIKTLLKKNERFEVVAEADDGEQLIEILNEVIPDVTLIDLSMPRLNGLESMKKLLAVNPNLKFIVLTMHEDPQYIVNSIQSGASGYLLKNVEFEELERAIITVAEGGKYFNQNIANIMIETLSKPGPPKVEVPSLTPRELEILKEVANGLSTKIIADKFSISARTVETHRVHLMKKMEVHNTAELVKRAIELGLI